MRAHRHRQAELEAVEVSSNKSGETETHLADAGGCSGDEHDLAAEVLPSGEGADEDPGDEAEHEGDGEVDQQHQRQADVHEAAQERVHHRLLAHLLPFPAGQPLLGNQIEVEGLQRGKKRWWCRGGGRRRCGSLAPRIYGRLLGWELMGGWGLLQLHLYGNKYPKINTTFFSSSDFFLLLLNPD